MKIDLLLTEEMKKTMPNTIEIVNDFGVINVRFDSLEEDGLPIMIRGNSVILNGETSEIIEWLKPFDGVPVGCGSPQLESFSIMHIKDEL